MAGFDACAAALDMLERFLPEGEEIGARLPQLDLGAMMKEAKARAKAGAAGAAGMAAPPAAAGAAGKPHDVGEDVDKLNKSLKEQIATFGMAEEEAQLYKLAVAGATPEMLAQARALLMQSKAQKDAKKLADDRKKAEEDIRKEMESEAKSIINATRTPAEKMQAEAAKLDKLHGAGLLDDETYNRGRRKIDKDAGLTGETKFAGALELGSKEARSALLRASGSGGDNKLTDINESQLATQRQMLGALQTIAGRAGDGGGKEEFSFI
jgi:hypothetical protein